MTDDMPTQESSTKTAADLAIEDLQKRLDAMESSYKKQIEELESANRGLWAAAHKAPEQDTVAEEPRGFDYDKAETAFFKALGRE